MEINGAGNNQLDSFLEGLRSVKAESCAKSGDGPAVDASLQTDYSALTAQALQGGQGEAEAVELAKGLMASGEFDSSEAACTAAENILTFGI